MKTTYIEIDEDMAGQRLDNFLIRELKGVPKSRIYRILRSGEVRVNSGRVKAGYRLCAGDRLRIPPIRTAALQEATEPRPGHAFKTSRKLPVLFEDDWLLVINKPAGLAVHGGSGISLGVIELLRQQRPDARFLELAHRLDRETSGILLIAKKRAALNALHQMFREQGGSLGMKKYYRVLVSGRWVDEVRHVRLPLLKFLTADSERRVCVAQGQAGQPGESSRLEELQSKNSIAGKRKTSKKRAGADNVERAKPSHTIFRLVSCWKHKTLGDFSLLEAELKTGRTHQIRVHLAHLGFPVVGDEKYGDFALNKRLQKHGMKRMALHALSMRLRHPHNLEEALELESPLSKEIVDFVQVLSSGSA